MATYSSLPLLTDYQLNSYERTNIPYQDTSPGTDAQRTLYTVPDGYAMIPHGWQQQGEGSTYFVVIGLSINAFINTPSFNNTYDFQETNSYTTLAQWDKGIAIPNTILWPGDKIIHNAPGLQGGGTELYKIKIWFWLAKINYDIIRP